MDEEKRESKQSENTAAAAAANSVQIKNSDVTQEYNRHNYEDKAKMKAYKEKTFGDNKTIKDEYTGKDLHKDHKAAKNKYKSKASEHQSETDHITPLKHIHDSAKNMKYINDEDIKIAANRERNFKEISKKQNASKGEKTNSEAAKDNDNLTTKSKVKMNIDGAVAEAGITAELLAKDLGRAGVAGIKSGAIAGASMSTASNIVAVAKGEKDISEAAIDTLVDTAKTTVVSGVTSIEVEVTSVAIKTVSNEIAKRASEKAISKAITDGVLKGLDFIGSNVGTIIATGKVIGSAVKRFAEGEIDSTDFLMELGQGGANILAGSVGAALGTAMLPGVGTVVGSFIGSTIGYLYSSLLYSFVLQAFQEAKMARERAIQMQQLCEAARKEMQSQREEFERNMDIFLSKRENTVKTAFEAMFDAWQNNDIDRYLGGLNMIAHEFGGKLQCATFEEFDEFMSDESTVFEF